MIGLLLKNIKLTKEKPIVAVPVIEKTGDGIIDKIKALASDGVKLIEWRLDYYEDCLDLEKIQGILTEVKKDVPKTLLLLTMRTKSEGGEFEICGEELNKYYVDLSKLNGFEIIDIQYHDASSEVVKKCAVNRKITILSYHNFSETVKDDELSKLLCAMKEHHPDILKFAFMPSSDEDIERTIRFSKEVRRCWHGRQILISMGEMGKKLRLNPFLTGSCVTFGCEEGKNSAPGQVYYKDLMANIESLLVKRKMIFLIGYMGTGKTTIGKELKNRLHYRLVDLDDLIEKNAGVTIKEMMAKEGEDYFRNVETKTLESLAGKNKLIVSCGGGVVLREENRKFIKENGISVLLEATPEQIFERIKHDTSRPLLAGNMNVEYIAKMKGERDPLYKDAAEITIHTENLAKFDICEKICNAYGEP